MWNNEDSVDFKDFKDFPVVENVVRIGKYPTAPQLKKLVLALYRGERLTPYKALEMCGTFRLSERMRELQALGWGINKALVKTENGAHVMSYWL